MQFEWDEAKRLINLAKHGVDFIDAIAIFAGFILEGEDERTDYNEVRVRALGQADDESYLVVYTWRDGKRRIISAWRLDDEGTRRYQELLS